MEHVTENLIKKHEEFITKLGFKIEKHEYSPEFGGSTYVIYVRGHLAIQVVKDRDGISYEFGDLLSLRKNEWYSLDIIRNFLSNKNEYIKLKYINPISFIFDNIQQLDRMFANNEREATFLRLKELIRKRGKMLFKKK
jgi:hypothetical protein